MKSLIFIILLFSINTLHALEIDEKLTLRFLKVSVTKKTVLINRGAEDGLVVGNHAKFFVTGGVVARGVVEKVSPSRSIWSLYRIIDPNEIADGRVLNLKIASPVKVTEDSSKSLADEPVGSGNERIPVESKGGGGDLSSQELDSFETDGDLGPATTPSAPATRRSKEPVVYNESSVHTGKGQWEIWTMVAANMLSGNSSNIGSSTTSATTSSKSSTWDLALGIEKYFFETASFLRQLSFTGFVHAHNTTTGNDIQVSQDLMEFGAGARYHFSQYPNAFNSLLTFALFDFGIGNITLTNTVTGATASNSVPIKGTSKFYALGLGEKYILSNGFGMRVIADYYSTSESYAYTTTTGTRDVAGFRLQVGLSYRF